jgi:hypothetical protein
MFKGETQIKWIDRRQRVMLSILIRSLSFVPEGGIMVSNHPNRSAASVTPEDLVGRYRVGQRNFAGVDLRDTFCKTLWWA